jgi:5'-nucleotidase
MIILLTNDDGIHAPGLLALHSNLSRDHQVWVVAPESEQSAVGHSITLADPIKMKKIRKNGELYGYALSGTPADCVRVGVSELMDIPPDLVISGINLGANVGINILYSGTVSAATEAAVLGVKAMAFSLDTFVDPDFTYTAELAGKMIDLLPDLELTSGLSLNINVPARPRDRILGVAWANQSLAAAGEVFVQRVDPRNNTYYWRGREIAPDRIQPDSDYALLSQGYVTITPIRYDLTHHEEVSRLKQYKIEV